MILNYLYILEGIPSTASDDCIGTYKYPTDCTSISTCIYILNWQSDGKSVHFSLNAATPPGHWSAVGFSTDGSMVQVCLHNLRMRSLYVIFYLIYISVSC